ncbi:hypothetical protein DAEQUDRAFT_765315 [Daedalea quercina L-15889]|uniref:Uncharacterized protein n=1 Tax=Daedalea quercina L-15889 TaxID=1314783 RepID=A0A165QNV7_9APHY|nr:hypothetical protein DAEQUDRAFT_765315 [Daedalea quercina L-15889]
MIPLHRTLARSPSTPLLLPSSSPTRPQLLVHSASFNPSSPSQHKLNVLSPLEVAHIAYFPVSASGSPKLGMNTHVRFVRPGRPSASLDVQSAHTPPAAPDDSVDPPSFERFQFTALRDRANVARPKQSHDSRARIVLKKLKARTTRLPLKLALRSGHFARLRSPRVPSDPELAFQDEQHRKRVCWRCRKAGGRQIACRAFKRPTMVIIPASMSALGEQSPARTSLVLADMPDIVEIMAMLLCCCEYLCNIILSGSLLNSTEYNT